MDTLEASEATIFEDPETGQRVDVGKASKDVLVKGPLYFAIHKVWKHAVASAILAILTVGISWFVYTVYAERIMRAHLLAQGWVPVAKEERDENSNFVILLAANIWVMVLMVLISYVSMIFPYWR